MSDWFTVRQIDDNTWVISEPYHWEENKRYGEVYDEKEQLIAKNIYIFDDFGNSLVEETYDSMNVLDTRICYEYMGTDGSISSGIPNEI